MLCPAKCRNGPVVYGRRNTTSRKVPIQGLIVAQALPKVWGFFIQVLVGFRLRRIDTWHRWNDETVTSDSFKHPPVGQEVILKLSQS